MEFCLVLSTSKGGHGKKVGNMGISLSVCLSLSLSLFLPLMLMRSWAGAVSPILSGGAGAIGGRAEAVGGCRIHDNISCMWLGRGSNTKATRVQLGRSGEPPLGGPVGRGGTIYTTISDAGGWVGAEKLKNADIAEVGLAEYKC